MGTITLEQIDLLMQRAHVTYAEAKEALERTNGDVLEALLFLEREAKIKTNKSPNPTAGQKINGFISKLNATRFIMRKKERVFVDVPLSVAIIAIVLCFYVSVVTLILSILLGIKVQIIGENDIAEKINSTINDIRK